MQLRKEDFTLDLSCFLADKYRLAGNFGGFVKFRPLVHQNCTIFANLV